jgi:tetratricopeptide (TPR) repeat protein
MPDTRINKVHGPRQTWLFVFFLVAITMFAYQPVWHGFFIWDDNLLIVQNPLLALPGGWWRVWTEKTVDYVPAVSSLWWLERQCWGIHPAPYHVVNLLLHAANAVLLWRLLARLKMPGALLAGALFALHPVNVETAAWVAEQKNTLAMFFFLGSLALYLKFDETSSRRWYWLSLAAFFLALASKTAVVPMPVVLLGMIWWRHGRLAWLDARRSACFFILAVAGSAAALWIQSGAVAGSALPAITFATRIARAGQAFWFYLGKDLMPIHLVAVYAKWKINAANPLAYAADVLAFTVFGVVWYFRHGWGRPFLLGLGYFAVMILPALGLFDISFMRYAWVTDHWQYFAIPGPIALVAAGVSQLPGRSTPWVVAGVLLTACGVLTWRQSRMYQGSETFWGAFMQANQPAIAQYDAGCERMAKGHLDEALPLFRAAIDDQPAFALPYNNIGFILLKNGSVDEALTNLQQAVLLRPDLAAAHFNLGRTLLAKGQTSDALTHFQRSADLQPRDAIAQQKFAEILVRQGLRGDATVYFQKALELAIAQNNTALAGVIRSQMKSP